MAERMSDSTILHDCTDVSLHSSQIVSDAPSITTIENETVLDEESRVSLGQLTGESTFIERLKAASDASCLEQLFPRGILNKIKVKKKKKRNSLGMNESLDVSDDSLSFTILNESSSKHSLESDELLCKNANSLKSNQCEPPNPILNNVKGSLSKSISKRVSVAFESENEDSANKTLNSSCSSKNSPALKDIQANNVDLLKKRSKPLKKVIVDESILFNKVEEKENLNTSSDLNQSTYSNLDISQGSDLEGKQIIYKEIIKRKVSLNFSLDNSENEDVDFKKPRRLLRPSKAAIESLESKRVGRGKQEVSSKKSDVFITADSENNQTSRKRKRKQGKSRCNTNSDDLKNHPVNDCSISIELDSTVDSNDQSAANYSVDFASNISSSTLLPDPQDNLSVDISQTEDKYDTLPNRLSKKKPSVHFNLDDSIGSTINTNPRKSILRRSTRKSLYVLPNDEDILLSNQTPESLVLVNNKTIPASDEVINKPNNYPEINSEENANVSAPSCLVDNESPNPSKSDTGAVSNVVLDSKTIESIHLSRQVLSISTQFVNTGIQNHEDIGKEKQSSELINSTNNTIEKDNTNILKNNSIEEDDKNYSTPSEEADSILEMSKSSIDSSPIVFQRRKASVKFDLDSSQDESTLGTSRKSIRKSIRFSKAPQLGPLEETRENEESLKDESRTGQMGEMSLNVGSDTQESEENKQLEKSTDEDQITRNMSETNQISVPQNDCSNHELFDSPLNCSDVIMTKANLPSNHSNTRFNNSSEENDSNMDCTDFRISKTNRLSTHNNKSYNLTKGNDSSMDCTDISITKTNCLSHHINQSSNNPSKENDSKMDLTDVGFVENDQVTIHKNEHFNTLSEEADSSLDISKFSFNSSEVKLPRRKASVKFDLENSQDESTSGTSRKSIRKSTRFSIAPQLTPLEETRENEESLTDESKTDQMEELSLNILRDTQELKENNQLGKSTDGELRIRNTSETNQVSDSNIDSSFINANDSNMDCTDISIVKTNRHSHHINQSFNNPSKENDSKMDLTDDGFVVSDQVRIHKYESLNTLAEDADSSLDISKFSFNSSEVKLPRRKTSVKFDLETSQDESTLGTSRKSIRKSTRFSKAPQLTPLEESTDNEEYIKDDTRRDQMEELSLNIGLDTQEIEENMQLEKSTNGEQIIRNKSVTNQVSDDRDNDRTYLEENNSNIDCTDVSITKTDQHSNVNKESFIQPSKTNDHEIDFTDFTIPSNNQPCNANNENCNATFEEIENSIEISKCALNSSEVEVPRRKASVKFDLESPGDESKLGTFRKSIRKSTRFSKAPQLGQLAETRDDVEALKDISRKRPTGELCLNFDSDTTAMQEKKQLVKSTEIITTKSETNQVSHPDNDTSYSKANDSNMDCRDVSIAKTNLLSNDNNDSLNSLPKVHDVYVDCTDIRNTKTNMRSNQNNESFKNLTKVNDSAMDCTDVIITKDNCHANCVTESFNSPSEADDSNMDCTDVVITKNNYRSNRDYESFSNSSKVNDIKMNCTNASINKTKLPSNHYDTSLNNPSKEDNISITKTNRLSHHINQNFNNSSKENDSKVDLTDVGSVESDQVPIQKHESLNTPSEEADSSLDISKFSFNSSEIKLKGRKASVKFDLESSQDESTLATSRKSTRKSTRFSKAPQLGSLEETREDMESPKGKSRNKHTEKFGSNLDADTNEVEENKLLDKSTETVATKSETDQAFDPNNDSSIHQAIDNKMDCTNVSITKTDLLSTLSNKSFNNSSNEDDSSMDFTNVSINKTNSLSHRINQSFNSPSKENDSKMDLTDVGFVERDQVPNHKNDSLNTPSGEADSSLDMSKFSFNSSEVTLPRRKASVKFDLESSRDDSALGASRKSIRKSTRFSKVPQLGRLEETIENEESLKDESRREKMEESSLNLESDTKELVENKLLDEGTDAKQIVATISEPIQVSDRTDVSITKIALGKDCYDKSFYNPSKVNDGNMGWSDVSITKTNSHLNYNSKSSNNVIKANDGNRDCSYASTSKMTNRLSNHNNEPLSNQTDVGLVESDQVSIHKHESLNTPSKEADNSLDLSKFSFNSSEVAVPRRKASVKFDLETSQDESSVGMSRKSIRKSTRFSIAPQLTLLEETRENDKTLKDNSRRDQMEELSLNLDLDTKALKENKQLDKRAEERQIITTKPEMDQISDQNNVSSFHEENYSNIDCSDVSIVKTNQHCNAKKESFILPSEANDHDIKCKDLITSKTQISNAINGSCNTAFEEIDNSIVTSKCSLNSSEVAVPRRKMSVKFDLESSQDESTLGTFRKSILKSTRLSKAPQLGPLEETRENGESFKGEFRRDQLEELSLNIQPDTKELEDSKQVEKYNDEQQILTTKPGINQAYDLNNDCSYPEANESNMDVSITKPNCPSSCNTQILNNPTEANAFKESRSSYPPTLELRDSLKIPTNNQDSLKIPANNQDNLTESLKDGKHCGNMIVDADDAKTKSDNAEESILHDVSVCTNISFSAVVDSTRYSILPFPNSPDGSKNSSSLVLSNVKGDEPSEKSGCKIRKQSMKVSEECEDKINTTNLDDATAGSISNAIENSKLVLESASNNLLETCSFAEDEGTSDAITNTDGNKKPIDESCDMSGEKFCSVSANRDEGGSITCKRTKENEQSAIGGTENIIERNVTRKSELCVSRDTSCISTEQSLEFVGFSTIDITRESVDDSSHHVSMKKPSQFKPTVELIEECSGFDSPQSIKISLHSKNKRDASEVSSDSHKLLDKDKMEPEFSVTSDIERSRSSEGGGGNSKIQDSKQGSISNSVIENKENDSVHDNSVTQTLSRNTFELLKCINNDGTVSNTNYTGSSVSTAGLLSQLANLSNCDITSTSKESFINKLSFRDPINLQSEDENGKVVLHDEPPDNTSVASSSDIKPIPKDDSTSAMNMIAVNVSTRSQKLSSRKLSISQGEKHILGDTSDLDVTQTEMNNIKISEKEPIKTLLETEMFSENVDSFNITGMSGAVENTCSGIKNSSLNTLKSEPIKRRASVHFCTEDSLNGENIIITETQREINRSTRKSCVSSQLNSADDIKLSTSEALSVSRSKKSNIDVCNGSVNANESIEQVELQKSSIDNQSYSQDPSLRKRKASVRFQLDNSINYDATHSKTRKSIFRRSSRKSSILKGPAESDTNDPLNCPMNIIGNKNENLLSKEIESSVANRAEAEKSNIHCEHVATNERDFEVREMTLDNKKNRKSINKNKEEFHLPVRRSTRKSSLKQPSDCEKKEQEEHGPDGKFQDGNSSVKSVDYERKLFVLNDSEAAIAEKLGLYDSVYSTIESPMNSISGRMSSVNADYMVQGGSNISDTNYGTPHRKIDEGKSFTQDSERRNSSKADNTIEDSIKEGSLADESSVSTTFLLSELGNHSNSNLTLSVADDAKGFKLEGAKRRASVHFNLDCSTDVEEMESNPQNLTLPSCKRKSSIFQHQNSIIPGQALESSLLHPQKQVDFTNISKSNCRVSDNLEKSTMDTDKSSGCDKFSNKSLISSDIICSVNTDPNSSKIIQDSSPSFPVIGCSVPTSGNDVSEVSPNRTNTLKETSGLDESFNKRNERVCNLPSEYSMDITCLPNATSQSVDMEITGMPTDCPSFAESMQEIPLKNSTLQKAAIGCTKTICNAFSSGLSTHCDDESLQEANREGDREKYKNYHTSEECKDDSASKENPHVSIIEPNESSKRLYNENQLSCFIENKEVSDDDKASVPLKSGCKQSYLRETLENIHNTDSNNETHIGIDDMDCTSVYNTNTCAADNVKDKHPSRLEYSQSNSSNMDITSTHVENIKNTEEVFDQKDVDDNSVCLKKFSRSSIHNSIMDITEANESTNNYKRNQSQPQILGDEFDERENVPMSESKSDKTLINEVELDCSSINCDISKSVNVDRGDDPEAVSPGLGCGRDVDSTINMSNVSVSTTFMLSQLGDITHSSFTSSSDADLTVNNTANNTTHSMDITTNNDQITIDKRKSILHQSNLERKSDQTEGEACLSNIGGINCNINNIDNTDTSVNTNNSLKINSHINIPSENSSTSNQILSDTLLTDNNISTDSLVNFNCEKKEVKRKASVNFTIDDSVESVSSIPKKSEGALEEQPKLNICDESGVNELYTPDITMELSDHSVPRNQAKRKTSVHFEFGNSLDMDEPVPKTSQSVSTRSYRKSSVALAELEHKATDSCRKSLDISTATLADSKMSIGSKSSSNCKTLLQENEKCDGNTSNDEFKMSVSLISLKDKSCIDDASMSTTLMLADLGDISEINSSAKSSSRDSGSPFDNSSQKGSVNCGFDYSIDDDKDITPPRQLILDANSRKSLNIQSDEEGVPKPVELIENRRNSDLKETIISEASFSSVLDEVEAGGRESNKRSSRKSVMTEQFKVKPSMEHESEAYLKILDSEEDANIGTIKEICGFEGVGGSTSGLRISTSSQHIIPTNNKTSIGSERESEPLYLGERKDSNLLQAECSLPYQNDINMDINDFDDSRRITSKDLCNTSSNFDNNKHPNNSSNENFNGYVSVNETIDSTLLTTPHMEDLSNRIIKTSNEEVEANHVTHKRNVSVRFQLDASPKVDVDIVSKPRKSILRTSKINSSVMHCQDDSLKMLPNLETSINNSIENSILKVRNSETQFMRSSRKFSAGKSFGLEDEKIRPVEEINTQILDNSAEGGQTMSGECSNSSRKSSRKSSIVPLVCAAENPGLIEEPGLVVNASDYKQTPDEQSLESTDGTRRSTRKSSIQYSKKSVSGDDEARSQTPEADERNNIRQSNTTSHLENKSLQSEEYSKEIKASSRKPSITLSPDMSIPQKDINKDADIEIKGEANSDSCENFYLDGMKTNNLELSVNFESTNTSLSSQPYGIVAKQEEAMETNQLKTDDENKEIEMKVYRSSNKFRVARESCTIPAPEQTSIPEPAVPKLLPEDNSISEVKNSKPSLQVQRSVRKSSILLPNEVESKESIEPLTGATTQIPEVEECYRSRRNSYTNYTLQCSASPTLAHQTLKSDSDISQPVPGNHSITKPRISDSSVKLRRSARKSSTKQSYGVDESKITDCDPGVSRQITDIEKDYSIIEGTPSDDLEKEDGECSELIRSTRKSMIIEPFRVDRDRAIESEKTIRVVSCSKDDMDFTKPNENTLLEENKINNVEPLSNIRRSTRKSSILIKQSFVDVESAMVDKTSFEHSPDDAGDKSSLSEHSAVVDCSKSCHPISDGVSSKNDLSSLNNISGNDSISIANLTDSLSSNKLSPSENVSNLNCTDGCVDFSTSNILTSTRFVDVSVLSSQILESDSDVTSSNISENSIHTRADEKLPFKDTYIKSKRVSVNFGFESTQNSNSSSSSFERDSSTSIGISTSRECALQPNSSGSTIVKTPSEHNIDVISNANLDPHCSSSSDPIENENRSCHRKVSVHFCLDNSDIQKASTINNFHSNVIEDTEKCSVSAVSGDSEQSNTLADDESVNDNTTEDDSQLVENIGIQEASTVNYLHSNVIEDTEKCNVSVVSDDLEQSKTLVDDESVNDNTTEEGSQLVENIGIQEASTVNNLHSNVIEDTENCNVSVVSDDLEQSNTLVDDESLNDNSTEDGSQRVESIDLKNDSNSSMKSETFDKKSTVSEPLLFVDNGQQSFQKSAEHLDNNSSSLGISYAQMTVNHQQSSFSVNDDELDYSEDFSKTLVSNNGDVEEINDDSKNIVVAEDPKYSISHQIDRSEQEVISQKKLLNDSSPDKSKSGSDITCSQPSICKDNTIQTSCTKFENSELLKSILSSDVEKTFNQVKDVPAVSVDIDFDTDTQNTISGLTFMKSICNDQSNMISVSNQSSQAILSSLECGQSSALVNIDKKGVEEVKCATEEMLTEKNPRVVSVNIDFNSTVCPSDLGKTVVNSSENESLQKTLGKLDSSHTLSIPKQDDGSQIEINGIKNQRNVSVKIGFDKTVCSSGLSETISGDATRPGNVTVSDESLRLQKSVCSHLLDTSEETEKQKDHRAVSVHIGFESTICPSDLGQSVTHDGSETFKSDQLSCQESPESTKSFDSSKLDTSGNPTDNRAVSVHVGFESTICPSDLRQTISDDGTNSARCLTGDDLPSLESTENTTSDLCTRLNTSEKLGEGKDNKAVSVHIGFEFTTCPSNLCETIADDEVTQTHKNIVVRDELSCLGSTDNIKSDLCNKLNTSEEQKDNKALSVHIGFESNACPSVFGETIADDVTLPSKKSVDRDELLCLESIDITKSELHTKLNNSEKLEEKKNNKAVSVHIDFESTSCRSELLQTIADDITPSRILTSDEVSKFDTSKKSEDKRAVSVHIGFESTVCPSNLGQTIGGDITYPSRSIANDKVVKLDTPEKLNDKRALSVQIGFESTVCPSDFGQTVADMDLPSSETSDEATKLDMLHKLEDNRAVSVHIGFESTVRPSDIAQAANPTMPLTDASEASRSTCLPESSNIENTNEMSPDNCSTLKDNFQNITHSGCSDIRLEPATCLSDSLNVKENERGTPSISIAVSSTENSGSPSTSDANKDNLQAHQSMSSHNIPDQKLGPSSVKLSEAVGDLILDAAAQTPGITEEKSLVESKLTDLTASHLSKKETISNFQEVNKSLDDLKAADQCVLKTPESEDHTKTDDVSISVVEEKSKEASNNINLCNSLDKLIETSKKSTENNSSFKIISNISTSVERNGQYHDDVNGLSCEPQRISDVHFEVPANNINLDEGSANGSFHLSLGSLTAESSGKSDGLLDASANEFNRLQSNNQELKILPTMPEHNVLNESKSIIIENENYIRVSSIPDSGNDRLEMSNFVCCDVDSTTDVNCSSNRKGKSRKRGSDPKITDNSAVRRSTRYSLRKSNSLSSPKTSVDEHLSQTPKENSSLPCEPALTTDIESEPPSKKRKVSIENNSNGKKSSLSISNKLETTNNSSNPRLLNTLSPNKINEQAENTLSKLRRRSRELVSAVQNSDLNKQGDSANMDKQCDIKETEEQSLNKTDAPRKLERSKKKVTFSSVLPEDSSINSGIQTSLKGSKKSLEKTPTSKSQAPDNDHNFICPQVPSLRQSDGKAGSASKKRRSYGEGQSEDSSLKRRKIDDKTINDLSNDLLLDVSEIPRDKAAQNKKIIYHSTPIPAFEKRQSNRISKRSFATSANFPSSLEATSITTKQKRPSELSESFSSSSPIVSQQKRKRPESHEKSGFTKSNIKFAPLVEEREISREDDDLSSSAFIDRSSETFDRSTASSSSFTHTNSRGRWTVKFRQKVQFRDFSSGSSSQQTGTISEGKVFRYDRSGTMLSSLTSSHDSKAYEPSKKVLFRDVSSHIESSSNRDYIIPSASTTYSDNVLANTSQRKIYANSFSSSPSPLTIRNKKIRDYLSNTRASFIKPESHNTTLSSIGKQTVVSEMPTISSEYFDNLDVFNANFKPEIFKKPLSRISGRRTNPKYDIENDARFTVDGKPYFRKTLKFPDKWVNLQLHQYLHDKLKVNYDIEASAMAENFIDHICSTVSAVQNLDRVKDINLATLVLRNLLSKYNICSNMMEYCTFITRYTPHLFQRKALPIAGFFQTFPLDFRIKISDPIITEEEILEVTL